MPQMQTQSIFLPYVNGGDALALSLSEAQVDGRTREIEVNSETAACDLSPLGSDWSDANLVFEVHAGREAPSAIELVPRRESGAPPIRLVGSCHCARTLRRWSAQGTWDSRTGHGRIDVPLARRELSGSIEMMVFLARTAQQSDDAQLATDVGARLMSSRQWRIYVDPPPERFGPGLPTRWEDFARSESPWRRGHSHLLFHLDTSASQPVLYLNERIEPDLRAVMEDVAPRGRKARLRNVVFAAIGLSVWATLLQTARRSLPTEGDPDPGWQRNVLELIATAVEPDATEDEALRTFLADLRDTSGGRGVEERIAAAILSTCGLREHAEALIAELV